jgi:hypothetical protein
LEGVVKNLYKIREEQHFSACDLEKYALGRDFVPFSTDFFSKFTETGTFSIAYIECKNGGITLKDICFCYPLILNIKFS